MDSEPSLSPKKGIQTVRGFVLVCAGLFLVVFAITFIVPLFIKPSANSPAVHVATFTGKDQGTTKPFTVKDHWEFRWTHNGHLKEILWKRQDGHRGLLMEMQRKPIRTHGSLNYGEAGEYIFEINGKGDWKIEVYQF